MDRAFIIAAALLATACGEKQDIHDFGTIEVTMPNGASVRADVLRDARTMLQGAMHRNSLAPARGLFYQYAKPGNYSFWAFQTRIPFDVIWLDRNRTVVEVAANLQPCKSNVPADCPSYGGHERAFAALQLAGGMAEKYGVRVGAKLGF